MADKVSRKGGKKNRKWGRNLASCKAYRLSNRREHNKLRRLRGHAEHHPNDGCALAAVERCRVAIRGY